MQMLQSGNANFFQWECSSQPELAYCERSKVPAADNVIEGECMTCTRHNSAAYICAESLSGLMPSSYSRVTVNN